MPVAPPGQSNRKEPFRMKATGIVRHIDELGRIVVPKEMRRVLGIANGDPVEIKTDGDSIVISKYHHACNLCGESLGVTICEFKGKNICNVCLDELKSNY